MKELFEDLERMDEGYFFECTKCGHAWGPTEIVRIHGKEEM